MGVIHCCSALRRSKSFDLEPESKKFFKCQLDILPVCPKCGNYILQITRVDFQGNVSVIRKKNFKALRLLMKLKPFIINNQGFLNARGKSFLYYNEFGVKKKCYSNLSTLKIGKFDNFDKILNYKGKYYA